MFGNRDFQLGEKFAKASGATLVTQDELLLQMGESKVVLMHGDTLCTDDIDYQQFRSVVRQAAWQENFLSLSIDERVKQAQGLRKASVDASANKQTAIMDVNAEAVQACMKRNDCPVLIHGHTHRPATHSLPALGATRYVLGDWHPDHAKYLRWSSSEGFQIEEFK